MRRQQPTRRKPLAYLLKLKRPTAKIAKDAKKYGEMK
jgi:hypothetical protein